MTFFDKKEEVFHIELTPYGRYLLSIGRLMPHHYRFLDDDVIYNSNSMGYGEKQNEAHPRITAGVPKVKPNANITGVQSSYQLNESDKRASTDITLPKKRIIQKDDQINHLQRALGTNSYETENGAAFQVDLFEGEIASSSKYMSGSHTVNLNIPQIDVDVKYVWGLKEFGGGVLYDNTNQESPPVPVHEGEYTTEVYSDNKYISVKPQNPIIRIKEYNSFDEKENFEVEAFVVEAFTNSAADVVSEHYTPFKMMRRTKKIINDMYVGSPTNLTDFMDSEEGEVNSEYLEYFLQINYDREIPDFDLCKTIGSLEIKNIFLDEYVDCEKILAVEELPDLFDPYTTRVSSDDLEDCD